jgi:glycosyltransferase involved in cell wall biosynthesis
VARRPEATVVVPTRDRWHLLSAAALPSALGQEDVELEVVVVDDGSRTEAPPWVAKLADPRVRLVRHPRPLGVAGARNTGIREATGKWIAFLDDDDLWSPQKLRFQLDAATSAGAGFAYGGAAAVAEDGTWLYSLRPVEAENLARMLLSRNVLWGGSSNVLARGDALDRLGGFDERLFQLCDWDLWIRLALTERAAVVRDVVVGCVVHDRSMLLVSEADIFDEFSYLRAKHRATSVSHGVAPDGGNFTRWVALGHRRAGRRRASVRTYLRGVVRHGDVTNLVRATAALVRSPADDAGQRARPNAVRAGWSPDPSGEPEWLGPYRPELARAIAQATPKASSPSER